MIYNFFNLNNLPAITDKTFIIWEPCTYNHAEIVPGYSRYLRELGYDVLVLITTKNLQNGLFNRYNDIKIQKAILSQRQIRRFVKSPAIKNAAGILVTTAGKLRTDPAADIDSKQIFGPNSSKPIFFVEHNVRPQIEAGYSIKNTITLSEIHIEEHKSIIINPHYFGNINITRKNNGKTLFLLVGAGQAKRRNMNLVFENALTLLKNGENNFEIRMIGKQAGKKIPDALQSHVNILGRISFDQLYQEVERGDFILTAFDTENPDHNFYKTSGTSGNFQLCYGFHKPCIIQREFGQNRLFTDKNSLLYNSNHDMLIKMRDAIHMSDKSYRNMQKNMAHTANQLYTSSLKNMELLLG